MALAINKAYVTRYESVHFIVYIEMFWVNKPDIDVYESYHSPRQN